MDVILDKNLDHPPKDALFIPHYGCFYHQLLACLGYDKTKPPVADLLRQFHGLDGVWVIASPIHWQATHNDVMLVAAGEALALSEEEGHLWFEALVALALPLGLRCYYHNAYTWLIQLNDDLQPPNAAPVHTLLHQSMMPHLESLDNTFFWQRFLTESQLLFSGHALNRVRKAHFSVNGLWIWGGGALDAPGCRPIVTDDEQTATLAQLLSTQVSTYDPSLALTKESLLLRHEMDDWPSLQKKLNNQTVTWYWNNTAYITKPQRWLTSLWRKLFHANNPT